MIFPKRVSIHGCGLVLAAVLLLAPGEARAANECGTWSTSATSHTCADGAQASGIEYSNIGGEITVTVTGGAATTINASTGRAWNAVGAVVVTAAAGTGSRDITLNVGTGSNAVVISEHGTASNSGVLVHQYGAGADDATVTLGSGVRIGTQAAPMRKFGVWLLSTADANTGTQTITSAATIHSTEYGIILDNRGAGDSAVTNTGSITTSATGGSANDKSGIRIIDWSGSFGADRTADTTTTVTNSGSVTVSAGNTRGIHVDAEGLGLYKVVNSGTVSTSGVGGHGIHVNAGRHSGAAGSTAVRVEHSGTITTTGQGGYGIRVDAGRHPDVSDFEEDFVVESSGTISASDAFTEGIHVSNARDGDVRVITTGGSITAGRYGIHVGKNTANGGAIRIDNAAAIEAGHAGIQVRYGGEGDVHIENRGTIVRKSDFSNSYGIEFYGIEASFAGAGDVTIVNRGDVTGWSSGIYALNTEGGGGAITVAHHAGEVRSLRGPGIGAYMGRWRDEDAADSDDPNSTATVRVEVTGGSVKATETYNRPAIHVENNEGGSAEVSVSRGATLTARHNVGIFAYLSDRQNTAGRIDVDQAGTIAADGGVYASATRASAAGETRADQPLIDVEWSGTFRQVERPDDGSWVHVAHAIEGAQEAQAGAVFRGAAHSAGIDAEVLSWRVLNRVATRGDDPGRLNAEKQANLLSETHADSRRAYVLTQFRTVLTAGTRAIPGADDIDTDDGGEYSDAELLAYLAEDEFARRLHLRDVLARGLSDQERAVLEALAENDGLDAALDGVTGATDAWKREVRALANRFNVGNIRVAMTGGSIASSGDGIRAWYAAAHDDNGRIDVTVAEGASVTGGQAGIYVANAGKGLRIARKYTPAYVMGVQEGEPRLPDGEEIVTLDEYLNQVVRVDGTVTGGADAAVHLVGGGALIVGETGKLVAGAGRPAVLVNDPGPAVVFIYGAATGAAGSDAAVKLTGGGIVTVGLNGMVVAGGATSAIQVDADAQVVVRTAGGGTARFTQQSVGAALGRIDGAIVRAGGDDDPAPIAPTVFLVEAVPVNGGERTTGYVLEGLEVGDDGTVTIPEELPTERFRCAMAADGRCHLYEALPAALLAMTGLPSREERMSAARDGNGGWARIEAASGKWTAASATQAGLKFDHNRFGVRAGVDVAAGEDARLGVSAHGLRGTAKTAPAVKAKLSGVGFGVHAAVALDGGFHVDAQAAATWYDVDVDAPDASGNDVKGRGYAAAVELGQRLALPDGVTVTPRAGLAWSDAALGSFQEVTKTDALAGAVVSVKDASSLTGRAGVGVASAASEGARLFGSLDVAHEFSGESAKKTSVRFGVGGRFDLGDGASLGGSAAYALGGGGNSEFGGGVSLDVQF